MLVIIASESKPYKINLIKVIFVLTIMIQYIFVADKQIFFVKNVNETILYIFIF